MRIVIIGAGAAGMAACRELIFLSGSSDHDKGSSDSKLHITLISAENCYPYYRPSLSKFCQPDTAADITKFYLQKPDWFKENRINILLSDAATRIDFEKQIVYTSTKRKLRYDKLIISSGCDSFKLPGINYQQPGVFSLINNKDIQKIVTYINSNNVKNALIIGGGILGCESANFLDRFNIKVSMYEMQPQIMPTLLTPASAIVMGSLLKNKGVNIFCQRTVKKIAFEQDTRKIKVTVVGSDNDFEYYDLVIINVGVRPNLSYLDLNKIKTGKGIICNNKLEASVPNVFVAGDVAEVNNCQTTLLWEPAVLQGKIIANNILKPSQSMIYRQQKLITKYKSFDDISLCVYGNQQDIKVTDELFVFSENVTREKSINEQKAFIYYNAATKQISYIATFNNDKITRLCYQLKGNPNLINIENFKQI